MRWGDLRKQLKGTVLTERAQDPGGYAGLGGDEGREGSQADSRWTDRQCMEGRKEGREGGREGRKFCVKQPMLINLYFLWSLWTCE